MNILEHHDLSTVYILNNKKYYFRGKCNEKQFLLCDVDTREYHIFNLEDYKVSNVQTEPDKIIANMILNNKTEDTYYLIHNHEYDNN
jgi:hypothetical protein